MPSKLKDFIRRKIIKSSKFSSVTLNATGFAVEAEVAAASVPQSTQQPDLNTSSLQKLAFSPGILTVNPTRPTPAVHSRSNSSFQTLIGSASGQDVADSTPPPSGIAVEPTSPLASPTSTLQRTPALRKRLFRADSRLRLNLDDGPSRFPFDTVEPPTTADDFPVHLARQVVNPGLLQGAQDISITGSTLQSAGRDIIVHNTPAVEISQVVKIMTHWLTKINQKAIWLDNISNWTEGTGSWFFELDKFRAWMEQDAGILCGTGMPGAGKTILSSRVLQHLQEHAMTSKENICVVFVFFRYMDRITTYDTLASLVRQHLESENCQERVFRLIKGLYDRHNRGSTYPSADELLTLLKQLSHCFSKNFYTLEGLDEAPKDTQVDILRRLSSLNVNLLITSRPLALLNDMMPTSTYVDITAQQHDIATLIERTILRYPRFRRLLNADRDNSGSLSPIHAQHRSPLEEKVFSTIQEKSRGMFLVAALQMETLRHCLNVKDLNKTLEELPGGVNDMYRVTMRRIKSQDPEAFLLVQQIFLWLLHARRSLTISELKNAVAVCPKTYKFEADRIVHEDDLASLCCGLITIDKESRQVRLIHYTAVDALKEILPTPKEHPHSFIASVCTQLLRDHNFTNSKLEDIWEFEDTFDRFPLLEYAYTNWSSHAKECSILPPPVSEFVQQCTAYPVQDKGRYDWKLEHLQSIHLLSWYDFPNLLDVFGKDDWASDATIFDTRTRCGRTPLALGSMNGHVEVAKRLLEYSSVEVNVRDCSGQTPLMLASERGHEGVVRLLLEVSDVEVNAQDGKGRTALTLASEQGHEGIAQLLLGFSGVEVNTQDQDRRTSLMVASGDGLEQVVRMLLEVGGIEVNAQDMEGKSALMLASERGYEGVVQLLLGFTGLDANNRDQDGRSALMLASRGGHKRVVQLLLEFPGIEVNAVDSRGKSALMLAAEQNANRGGRIFSFKLFQSDHLLATKALLEFDGIEVNTQDEEGRSALILAAKRGVAQVVQSLLEFSGTEVDARDRKGRTALMFAAEAGRVGVVQLLLACSTIEFDAMDNDGKSALDLALDQGHQKVVQILEGRGQSRAT